MKLFRTGELFAAYTYVREGGQALHLYKSMPKLLRKAPRIFQKKKQWGHLLDMDKERLVKTGRKFGVSRIVIHKPNTHRQHIDLCGKPLEKAIKECEKAKELKI